jgi:homoserine kinase
VAAARVKGGVHAVRLALDVSLAFVAIVPDVPLSTARARQALPLTVSRDSAAFNLSRMALLIAGLADSRVLINEAMEDRLHQDYRSPLFPAAPKLLAGMAEGGALAVCWSGAGPTLLGVSRGTEVQSVQAAAAAALADADIAGHVLVLHPDMHGLILDRDGAADVFDFNAEP